MTGPTTMEGIAITLQHMTSRLDEVHAVVSKAPTRDEMREADASLRSMFTASETDRKTERATLEAKVESLSGRVRTLEDDRTERKAVIWLIGAVVTVLGVPGLILVLRAFLATPNVVP